MNKFGIGVILIIMMFGHNFVLNQTQAMQKAIQDIHKISVTEFNLLYSIPSAVSLFFIVPMGFLYDRCSNALLLAGGIALSLGQLLVTIFGSNGYPHYYQLLMTGRVFEGVGAEILYMVQGNLASSRMGKMAGLVFILPEIGEILNVFATPLMYINWGILPTFFVGFITCFASTVACIILYRFLVKNKKRNEEKKDEIEAISDPLSDGTEKESSNRDSGLGLSKNTLTIKEKQIEERPLVEVSGRKINIFTAGRIFWLLILLCAINQCLFFPFLDNGNQLITTRFCIPYSDTGFYLSLPFLSAMLTSCLSSYLLANIGRNQLILASAFIPLLGHAIIFFDQNCVSEPTMFGQLTLILGLIIFGMGIGSYYSISFPAVGLSVPAQIRGTAYACMGFFQTISMTIIPIFSGLIVEEERLITKLSEGYRQSSILFVIICILGVIVSGVIFLLAKDDSFQYDDEERAEEMTHDGQAIEMM